jgi:predicted GNAT family acetyltransferase
MSSTSPLPEAYTVDREGADTGVLLLKRQGATVGRLDYHLVGDVIYVDFVEVPPAERGLGLGARLVDAAAQWARESSRSVVPICGYARRVLTSDARYRDVFERDSR